MANRYWMGATDADWNDAGNWSDSSGGGVPATRVPDSTDVAIFDGSYTNPNCTCDVGVDVLGIDVQSSYDGIFQLASFSHAIGASGFIMDGSGGVDQGSSTITVSQGNYDNVNQTTFTRGTSEVVMAGTGTILGNSTKDLHDLTIAAGAITTLSALTAGRLDVQNVLNVAGEFTINKQLAMIIGSAAITVQAGGEIKGTGKLTLVSGADISLMDGAITTSGIIELLDPITSTVIAPGTYVSKVNAFATAAGRVLRLSAGVYVFGDLELQTTSGASTTLTMDNATNGPSSITLTGDLTLDGNAGTAGITIDDSGQTVDWILQGDVVDEVDAGGFTWTEGLGDVTLSGNAVQDIDFAGATIPAIEFDKPSGGVTLSGILDTPSFVGTDTGSGNFDPNGQAIGTNGNCSWADVFTFPGDVDAFNGCAWTVGGNFTADGQTINATASWDLTVTGTAVARGSGGVAHSDASGGTEINASAGPWTDNGNNIYWNFGAIARHLVSHSLADRSPLLGGLVG